MKSDELKDAFEAYKAAHKFAPVAAAQVTDGIWDEVQSLMELRESLADRTAKLVSARPAAE